MACSLVRVPLSVAKSRVQLGLAPSAGAALRQAYATGGAAALYTGFGATLALDVAVAVVQFTALDAGRRPRASKDSAARGVMAAAGTAASPGARARGPPRRGPARRAPCTKNLPPERCFAQRVNAGRERAQRR